MKLLQTRFAFGLALCAGLIFAGCSETDTTKTDTTKPVETSGDHGMDMHKDGDMKEGGDMKEEGDMKEKAPEGDSSAVTNSDFQLVSLNVPNMSCPMCASSVKSALVEVDGIDKDSIETDPSHRIVKFKAKKGIDLDKSLAAHSDNSHLKDWSVAEN